MKVLKADPLPLSVLPPGIRSRMVKIGNGLDMHVLEAGDGGGTRPTVVLLHGFPEVAFCWRKLMPILADNGYHVVAPDQRGYGRTSPHPVQFEESIDDYSVSRLAGDIVALTSALKVDAVHAIVGHDFGAIVAGVCALTRPDIFRGLALLATPFTGAPARSAKLGVSFLADPLHTDLLKLNPPRKHYQRYYAERRANDEMWHCPQGIKAFLRGYYHQKSASWQGDAPTFLKSWSADEIARLPQYYCMPADLNMAEIAAQSMPGPQEIVDCSWLTEQDLLVVAAEFARTGFQGGLQWYRSYAGGVTQRDLQLFAGRKIEVPTIFIAGRSDWGAFQGPGILDAMRERAAIRDVPIHFIEGAGHWLQQEQPEQLAKVLLSFLPY